MLKATQLAGRAGFKPKLSLEWVFFLQLNREKEERPVRLRTMVKDHGRE